MYIHILDVRRNKNEPLEVIWHKKKSIIVTDVRLWT